MFLNIIYTLWCAQTSGELFDKISMNIMKAHNTFTSTHTPFSAPPSHPETLGLCCLFLTFYLLNYIICMSVFGLFQSAYYSETYIYCLSISNWFLPFFFFFVWTRTVQFSSATQSCPTLCHPMDFSTPGFPVHHQLPELAQTHVLQVCDAIQPSHPVCCPLLFPPSIFPSIRVFSNESALRISWPKYWSFSFSISRSNEYSGLIAFRMDWLDLLQVQGTLKSLPQHHSSKLSILWHSAFFIIQLSHPYMTIGKTIALTRQSSIGKIISLLYNMLSRLVIVFLPRSKQLLISWLKSPSPVILEPKE